MANTRIAGGVVFVDCVRPRLCANMDDWVFHSHLNALGYAAGWNRARGRKVFRVAVRAGHFVLVAVR